MAFSEAVERVRKGADLAAETEALLGLLTPDEKLWLLDGDDDFWPGLAEMSAGYNLRPIVMGAVDRLGIPGLRFSDGPRGVVMGASTAFPVSMARGATWDVRLEERVGVAIGREMRAQGANFFGGVCINLPRHPAWGRIQETYGEDPVLLGEFGAALVRGVRRNAMAVAKHYALNSMENARFQVDVRADEATLHEVYLPHFRRVVEEGVDGIMTAYNSVNGEWAGQNETLMEGVLRGQWGFEGVTVSDFIFGLRDPALSLSAGLDVEEPFRQQRAQLGFDRFDAGHVDRAARRILGTQLAFYASGRDEEPGPEVVFSAEHRALAREVSRASMVLLKNEGALLPLDASALSSVAVIGRLADTANTGDHGSSDVRSPEVVTVVVIVTAGAVITEEWRADVPAVLLGAVDASGRLSCSIPSDERHLPFFDREATSITYDRWHGQRLLDRDGIPAAFPLGFGLSYTSFALADLAVAADLTATVTVTDTGARAGRHVVQLYGVVDAPDFPRRVLLGFAPVTLEAGASARVTVAGSSRPLQRWTDRGFVPAAEHATIEAAAHSGDPDALSVRI